MSARRPRNEEDDLFGKEEIAAARKSKVPHAWKRLHLNNDYFENSPSIKTFSIKDTLSIDSGVSTSFDSGRSGFTDMDYDATDSSKKSPDLHSRKSLEGSDDHETKKKTWLFTKRRNKKKAQKLNNEMNHSDSLDKMTDSPPVKTKSKDKVKRHSMDSTNLLMADSKSSGLPVNRNHRKSEGDINFNMRYAINQQYNEQQQQRGNNFLTPNYKPQSQDDANNGIQMSLC